MIVAQTKPRVASCHRIVWRCCTRSKKRQSVSSWWVTNREGNITYEDESKRSSIVPREIAGYTYIIVDDASMCVRLMLWSHIHSQQTFPLKLKSSNLKCGQMIPPDCWQWWLPRLRWIRQWLAMRRNRWGIRDEEILRRGWRCRWRRWGGRRTRARSGRSLPSSEPWWPLGRRWCLSHCNRRF